MKSEPIEIEKYLPNYKKKCEVCKQTPTVQGVNKQGKIVYNGDMCGVCTWGEAACLDPDNWNTCE